MPVSCVLLFPSGRFHAPGTVAHSTIAGTCLSFLNSRQAKGLPATPAPKPPTRTLSPSNTSSLSISNTQFLGYSSLYWGIHAKRDLSDCALKLVDDCNNHVFTQFLSKAQKQSVRHIHFDKLSRFNGLHYASIFVIDEIAACSVEVEGYNIKQKDSMNHTPLGWAARNGHEGVVRVLLSRDGIDPDKPGEYGMTPLAIAAWNGHEGVVKILLGRDDVNPNGLDVNGETPLLQASHYGCEGIVKLLLGRDDIDPNKSDERGGTPLSRAAYVGHEGIVKILLGRDDVDPNKSDDLDYTPLFQATYGGHAGIVKMLLGRDGVDPNKPNGQGLMSLRWAVENSLARALVQHLIPTARPKPGEASPSLPPLDTVLIFGR